MTMQADRDDLDVFIEAAGKLLDLPLEPDWQTAVRANLEVTLAHARNVLGHPLPDEAEPAFVFGA